MQLGERLEAGLGSSMVFRKFFDTHTDTHTRSKTFFFFFLIWNILRSSLAAVILNVQKVLSKISEALLKGAMCCVFKHQYVIVKLIVTPWYNYHKQMRQRSG